MAEKEKKSMSLVPTVLVPFPPPAPHVCVFTASSQLHTVLRILVEQAGMQVVEPSLWTDAFACASSTAPTVVFADLDAAEGYELLRRLRLAPQMQQTTLVGLSTSASLRRRWQMQMIGARLLITPFMREEVLALLPTFP